MTVPNVRVGIADVLAELRRIVGDHAVDLAIERAAHAATLAQLVELTAAPEESSAPPA